MRHLLDTSVVSVILRDPAGRAARRFREVDQAGVGTSIVVAAELRFGYVKSGGATRALKIEGFLALYPVAPWDRPCDEAFAHLRADLERRGEPIGTMDMLIAAHALALDAILVTDNEREFGRVAGLKIENWVR